jgi:hypothetical protein
MKAIESGKGEESNRAGENNKAIDMIKQLITSRPCELVTLYLMV